MVADQTQVMVVFICQEGKEATVDKARNLVTLTDQRMMRVKTGLVVERGTHPLLPSIAWPTQIDGLFGKVASFALRRALHGLELPASPLDREIPFACGDEVHCIHIVSRQIMIMNGKGILPIQTRNLCFLCSCLYVNAINRMLLRQSIGSVIGARSWCQSMVDGR